MKGGAFVEKASVSLSIPMEELVPLIVEVISSGQEFRLYPRGKSMLPTIEEGKDSVALALPSSLQTMDAVLYVRANGQYVLHRIVALRENDCDMCGDNQCAIEKGVPRTSILAKVTAIYHGECRVEVTDRSYQRKLRRVYAKKPFGRILLSVKRILYPLYRRLRPDSKS